MKYGANARPTKSEKNVKSASQKFGSIAGTTILDTTDAAGKAVTKQLGGVHLRLLNSKGKVIRATQTKTNGDFKFKNVKPGTYTLTAKCKSYQLSSAMTINVVVVKGKTTNVSTIKFKK